MRCPICDGEMERKKIPYTYNDTSIGRFDADVCVKCGEKFFTQSSSDEIDERVKKLGLWGLEKKSKITYGGNSLMVRIPKSIAKFMNLKKGKPILIHPEGKKKIVVEVR